MHARSHPAAPFRFTKWYFDCVAEDGHAAIGYWASLAWRGLDLHWQNVTLYAPGRTPVGRSSLAASPPPHAALGTITCGMRSLDCVVNIESRQRPIEECLFESDEGRVEWRVDAPAAAVSFELPGFAAVRGAGYAERIFMTIPPWRLPIRELRWGRWIDPAARRSVVWIDWRGTSPCSWVFVDGIRAPTAVVTEQGPSAGSVKVLLGEGRTLHARAFADVAATIAPLRKILPKSLLALRETKWCSAGTRWDEGAAAQPGCAIHEVAVFR